MLGTVSPTLLRAPVFTPLLREGSHWIKAEGGQPSGSVKYRMVYAKLRSALESGAIDPQTVLIEVTSGSTGVALAYAGKQLGLRVELHAYKTAGLAKRISIREFGAKLVLHPPETPMPELLDVVARKVEAGGYWTLGQYDRVSNAAAYSSLGKEIVEQVRQSSLPAPKSFVCAVGTGGLIQGLGGLLRWSFPGLKVVAVEPEPGASIDGMRNAEELNLGPRDPFDRSFPDERFTVPAPRENACVHGFRLGDSATAVYTLIRSKGWSDTITVAAD